eukprot:2386-Heterococcus_DN1.PRE.12
MAAVSIHLLYEHLYIHFSAYLCHACGCVFVRLYISCLLNTACSNSTTADDAAATIAHFLNLATKDQTTAALAIATGARS